MYSVYNIDEIIVYVGDELVVMCVFIWNKLCYVLLNENDCDD